MKDKWQDKKWGEIATLEYGRSLQGYSERKTGVPVFGTNGPIGWHTEPLCQHPTVVIGRKGAYRGVHYSPSPCFVIDTAFYLEPKIELDVRWAYYQLLTQDINSMDSGSAIPSTSRGDFYQLPVLLPPIHDQRAIASVLGALDDKIELNHRMNETLEALAQSLFKSWFIDATRDGVPKGWREAMLGEVTGFLGGYAFKSNDWIERGVPVVKIGSVKPGIVDLNEVSFVSDEVAEQAKRFRLSAGDLLIGMTGYVGEVGLIPPTDNPPLLNQRVGKFLLEKPGTSALGFLYCLTRRPEFKADVEVKSHGTAQANVSADGILSVPITIPPDSLRDEFNRICEPILNRILANHAESRTLAALRDVLLPKLMSGELRVPASPPKT